MKPELRGCSRGQPARVEGLRKLTEEVHVTGALADE